MEALNNWFGILFGVNPDDTSRLFPNSEEVTETFFDLVQGTGLCGWLGLSMFLLTLLMCYVYYYIIDSPNFNKLIHWVLWAALTCIVTFGVAFWISQYISYNGMYITELMESVTEISEGIDDYDVFNETFDLSLAVAGWSIIVFIIWSFAIRLRSINCRKTPF